MVVVAVFGGVFVVLGLLAVAAGLWNLKRYQNLASNEQKSGREVTRNDSGITLEGTVTGAAPGNSVVEDPFSGEDSVIYQYEVERENPEDSGGNLTTVKEEAERIPFTFTADGERFAVDPADAELILDQRENVSLERGTALAQRIDPSQFGSEVYTYIISGQSLLTDSDVLVSGTVTGTRDDGTLEIDSAATDGSVYISDGSLEGTKRQLIVQSTVFVGLGLAFVAGTGYLLLT